VRGRFSGYVRFDGKRKVLILEQLEDFQTLGINKDKNVLLVKSHQDYLAFHREERFKS
jgi:hypothetical protein